MNILSLFGTATRTEFWVTTIMCIVAMFVGLIGLAYDAAIITLIICLPAAWIALAVTVRRIRDTGCSGWFYIVFMLLGLIPFVGWFAQIIWLCLPKNIFKREIMAS